MAPSAGTRSKKMNTPAKKSKAVAAATNTPSASAHGEAGIQADAAPANAASIPTEDMMDVEAQAESAEIATENVEAASADDMLEDTAASAGAQIGGENKTEEPVLATQAEELHRLDTKGRVVTIYDSVWTMEDVDTIKVYPGYQGETVVFKVIPSGPRSNSKLTYKAVYSAGPYKAVYSCEKGTGFDIFHNFTLDFANNAMAADFASDPLTFKFVDTMDKIRDVEHPYLYLEVHVDRANGKYFGSWAKRRDSDQEQIDPSRKIYLLELDISKLWTRMEINMMHPWWSRYHVQTKPLNRPWWNGWPESTA